MNFTKKFVQKQRILDFSKCEYWSELYQVIQSELELPIQCGQNLDALWDVITGFMYVPADITIIYKPETKKSEELTSEIGKIIDVFKEAQHEYNEITVTVDMFHPNTQNISVD